MGEQGVGDGLRIGQLQQPGQSVASGAGEVEALVAHRLSLRRLRRVVGEPPSGGKRSAASRDQGDEILMAGLLAAAHVRHPALV